MILLRVCVCVCLCVGVCVVGGWVCVFCMCVCVCVQFLSHSLQANMQTLRINTVVICTFRTVTFEG